MENQHREIKGYLELNETEIALMNCVKEAGAHLGTIVDSLRANKDLDQRWVSIGATDLQTGLMALTRAIAKPTFFLWMLCAVLLTGCAQSSETVRHGDTSFLLTQTQNQWAENVVLVSECEKDLVNGMCKPKGEVKVLVISGKLPELVGGLKHDAVTLGSAFVIRDGLIKSKANVKQNNQTDIRASTVNPKQ